MPNQTSDNLDFRRPPDELPEDWSLRSGANIIIDGQWGSTGRGKLASVLGPQADLCACDCIPNAGHTAYLDGVRFVSTQLPIAAMFSTDDVDILLGPGAVLNEERLLDEMFFWLDRDRRVLVDWRCTRNCPEDGSEEYPILAGQVIMVDAAQYVCKRLRASVWPRVLVESAQGFGLSLGHGFYPRVTSRNCTPWSCLDRCGIPGHALRRTYGIVRTYPIRVGGPSGPRYRDQHELKWSELPSHPEPERTTVTNRERRVFTWSRLQFQQFVEYCRPTNLLLTFVDYLVSDGQAAVENLDGTCKVHEAVIRFVGREITPFLSYAEMSPWIGLSWGPLPGQIAFINPENKLWVTKE